MNSFIYLFREEIRKEIQEIKSQLSKKKKKDKIKDQPTVGERSESNSSVDPLKQEYLENMKLYSSKKNELNETAKSNLQL